MFGDSLSDKGNLYTLTGQRSPASPPYYQERYSNGPIWAEHLRGIAGVPVDDLAIAGARANYQNISGPYGGLRSQVDDYLAGQGRPLDPDFS